MGLPFRAFWITFQVAMKDEIIRR